MAVTPVRAASSKPKSTPKAKTATTTKGGPASGGPNIGGCPVFPADNAWNRDISALPVHPQSSTWVTAVSQSKQVLHPDTGSDPSYGIPVVIVPATQRRVPITYVDYGDESDPGPFPIPLNATIEGGGDGHIIVVQAGTCKLFELFGASRTGAGFSASSGATFDLRTNAVRPLGWTSADAAGLAILPGLLRFDEVRTGEIRHALRFTVQRSQQGFIAPARHSAGKDDASLPPMGARFRLRSDFDVTPFKGDALVILKALKRYGMFVADNGSSWYITGAADPRWNDDDLGQLKKVPGSAFEVVDTGPITPRP